MLRGVIRSLTLAVPLGFGVAVEAATVENIRLWSGPESTRVVLDLSAPADHRVLELAGPDRVVIDLPRSSLRTAVERVEPRGFVSALRAGTPAPGELRLVLDLKQPVRPKSFLLPPGDGFGHRLVVDLLPATAMATAAPAVSARPPAPSVAAEPVARRVPAPAAPRAATGGRELVIAIDAGHGGEDPGAIGRRGGREKDVVLAIAKRLAEEIREQPGMRPLLIRDGDYLVSHRKRTQIARDAEADFFISIHADSYRDASAQGVTVYVLSEKGATDEAALLVAKRENADLIGGVSLADKDQVLARVLVDLSQGAALSASTAAGERLIRQLGAVTTLRRSSVQRAPFLVLKAPDIPSLLIETGYISNPSEEALLRDPKHQARIARALRAGIVDYFVDNPPPGSRFAQAGGSRQRVPVQHVISRGETLSTIAERYRVSTSTLRRSNSLKSDVIRVGQILTIPPG